MVWAAVLLAAVSQPISYVRNGAFDSLRGWQVPVRASLVERAPGDRCLLVTDGMGLQRTWRRKEWTRMSAAVDLRVEQIEKTQPNGFAFAAIYQFDEGESLVAFRDFVQVREPTDWQRYEYTFDVAPEAATVRMHFGFYLASGRAYFDNWTLVEGEQAMGISEVQEWASAASQARRVVVWQQPDLALPPGGMAPEWAAGLLRDAGIEADLITAEGLADSLRPGRAALLVLPYGPRYPEEVRPALVDFCCGGGKLLCVGGYPLDDPIVREGGKWVSWREQWPRRRGEAARWPANLLPDGGFEHAGDAPVGGKELDGRWRRDDAQTCTIVDQGAPEGRSCALVEVKPGEEIGERKWYTWLPARPGREYLFRVRVRTEGVGGEHYAYAAVYQYAGEELVRPKDVVVLREDTDWRETQWEFTTAPGVNALYIKMGFYRAHGRAWFDQVQLVDVTGLSYRPLNTSSAKPGDGLETASYQMGMCDADFRLKRVAAIQPAEGQWLVREVKLSGPATGWATTGAVGYNEARWVPLLDARDRFGRLRGAAGALMVHYNGFYNGSMWAYFGVADRPVFGPQVPGSGEDLERVVRFLLRGLSLNSLDTDYDSYRAGETVKAHVEVANVGPEDFSGEVQLTLEGAKLYGAQNVELTVAAGEQARAEGDFAVPECPDDVLRVRARLVQGAEPLDQMQTGVVLRRPEVDARAPMLTFRDNYFRLGDRPIFLFGSDNYSNDYKSAALNPGRWDEIQALARDYGLQVYENLQYSNPGYKMEEADWRSFDAMGQLLQKRGLVFMCGLIIGGNVAVNEQELAAEGQQCFEYAQRLGKMPALLWYINGDYQLRYEDMDFLGEAWRHWLRERYGTDEALREAWGREDLPPIAELPFPPQAGSSWADPVRRDQVRFNVWLMRRWNENHVRELRRVDPEHAITSEYYSEPWGGIDQRQTIDGQDVSNFGFFSTPQDDLTVLPERLAINDLRAVGKGVTMGEYGVKTHPAWTVENGATGYHIVRTEEEQKQLFMSVAAYALGMGASKVQNWCLRDADERVFPWGYFYPGRNVPKDVAYVHRNLSMMWRLVEPRYEAPETTIVVPTPLRVGNGDVAGRQAVYGATQGLLRLHVPFNVLDDFDLGRVPRATRTLLWPAAVAADEEHFQAALDWVRKGGQLILTGLPGWDDNRRALGDGRLRRLLGCGAAGALFEGVSRQAGAAVTAEIPGLGQADLRPQVRVAEPGEAETVLTADDGTLLILRRALGKGTVVWVADPVELAGRDEVMTLVATYRLALASLPHAPGRLPVEPDDADVHVMRQRTARGWVWVLYDTRLEGGARPVAVQTAAGEISVNLRPRWPAVVAVGDDGRVLMVLGDAPVRVDDEPLVQGSGCVGLASLDARDVRQTSALMVCPFSPMRAEVAMADRRAIEWGEWRDGSWTVLEQPAAVGAGLRLRLDDEGTTLVGLVCAAGEAERWRQRLGEIATRPWQHRGY